MINKKRLIKLLRDLIRINSQNPGSNEREIASFVGSYLKRIGIRSKIYEFSNRRSNIIAVLKSSNNGNSLLISPHLDTVPAGSFWSVPVFSGIIRDGKIYGLGATDCKVNLACAIEAINSITEDKKTLGYNLVFAASADEETGSGLGLIPLLRKGLLKVDEALILDADDFAIVVAQKGLMHIRVKVFGKRAHGAYPHLGDNAINKAVDIIRELQGHRFRYKKNHYLRAPTVNIGTIHGGDKVNIVADWCSFEVDIRSLPGMHQQDILKTLRKIVAKHARRFIIEIDGIQKPYSICNNHNMVRSLSKSMRKFKARHKITGSEGATVITFFQDKKIPAIATGFGVGACAHSKDEYVTVDNLYKGARILEDFLINYRKI